jgi:hypothetical protein
MKTPDSAARDCSNQRKFERLKHAIQAGLRELEAGHGSRLSDLPAYKQYQHQQKIAHAQAAGADGIVADEPYVVARSRLVAELLRAGWSIRTIQPRGEARRPELWHPDRSYAIRFSLRHVWQDDVPTVSDYRGWSLQQLLAYCDPLSTFDAQRRHLIEEAKAAMRAGQRGLPHEVVKKQAEALIAARRHQSRRRPARIPVFATEADERAFWATHDVVEYFSTLDFLEELAPKTRAPDGPCSGSQLDRGQAEVPISDRTVAHDCSVISTLLWMKP